MPSDVSPFLTKNLGNYESGQDLRHGPLRGSQGACDTYLGPFLCNFSSRGLRRTLGNVEEDANRQSRILLSNGPYGIRWHSLSATVQTQPGGNQSRHPTESDSFLSMAVMLEVGSETRPSGDA